MTSLIVLSGPIGVGKSSFAKALARFDVERVSTREYILKATGCENERGALQKAGEELDTETNGTWVIQAVEEAAKAGSGKVLLLDSARIKLQVDELRSKFPGRVFHVHLHAADEELKRRYAERPPELKEFSTYAKARDNHTEAQVGTLRECADLILDTDHSDPDTLAVTAMAVRGQAVPVVEPLVDVIVGGQYGSEGKGNICAYIARNWGYEALIRIGGPNAGHRVADPPYKYVQLPSGTGSNDKALILIGAGSTLWLPQLMLEIMDQKLGPKRLAIDPQAMVIDDDDRRAEEALESIASTKQGVGAATARKIVNRGDKLMFGPKVVLAGAVKQLQPYIRDVRAELDRMYREGKSVLLEGTQGTALSIHHGLYPHVTSRETSAAGCLSDAGVSPKRVKRIIMVLRTYPIRVGGTSGWMGRTIEFDEVSQRSGIPLKNLEGTEKGTISGTKRRMAEFDWGQLRRAVELNGATDIALTFADYLGLDNQRATSFAELNGEAQDFIRKVDRVAGVNVTLVSKAFAIDAVIERGSWS
jgi:adenylosuccinate synthase